MQIFDIIRKKFVSLQPEEWVRQHIVHQLILDKGYSKNHINVEKQLTINNMNKRYDVVVYNNDASIHLLVECKAPHIKIDQKAFDQIARYNMQLNSSYLMVSNGLDHFFCEMDYDEEKYVFLEQIPDFSR